jgi:restriction endonuclease-like protein
MEDSTRLQMGDSTRTPSSAEALRRELGLRNREYATRNGLFFHESVGSQVVCYQASEDHAKHGNFLAQSYQAILKKPQWSRRLEKPHTSAYRALPRDGLCWRELDSSTSSDALLMNVFCFPGILKQARVVNLLGVEAGAKPEFGFKARVPLAGGRVDRTEVDMRLGDLLVEAKLTEGDFQRQSATVVEAYRDFQEVFDLRDLPREKDLYASYQLIRNVLAAYANTCRFCVMLDERRQDLREAWYAVMRCIRIHDLRLACKVLTWQELAAALPAKLQTFLAGKYGIVFRETR